MMIVEIRWGLRSWMWLGVVCDLLTNGITDVCDECNRIRCNPFQKARAGTVFVRAQCLVNDPHPLLFHSYWVNTKEQPVREGKSFLFYIIVASNTIAGMKFFSSHVIYSFRHEQI